MCQGNNIAFLLSWHTAMIAVTDMVSVLLAWSANTDFGHKLNIIHPFGITIDG